MDLNGLQNGYEITCMKFLLFFGLGELLNANVGFDFRHKAVNF